MTTSSTRPINGNPQYPRTADARWRSLLCSMSKCLIFYVMLTYSTPTMAQLEFESDPINYDSAPINDSIQNLQAKIERGELAVEYDDQYGYLKSLLEHFDVPISSQMLVFSKTSFQLNRITPQRPRAVYFNDDVYVGWVQGGDVVEVSSADPQQGAIFYTVSQEKSEHPVFTRDRGQCIVCHASSRTSGVPGHLVRSVYASRSGQPFFGSGTFTTDHRSPFKERWGGWYVTGTHGEQWHMGNVVADREGAESFDMELGANVTDLSSRINTRPYLTPHSDIVALMVLEHQTRMHNLITRANFETRSALHYDTVMNKALDRPAEYRSESAQRRIQTAAEKLVEYMLFADEFPLTHAVQGTSGFASEFSLRGPSDNQGRSLREFDLTKRMMKYPCSYLIYSKPFDNLPTEVKDEVYRRLFAVLTSGNRVESDRGDGDTNKSDTNKSGTDKRETDDRFVHLSTADRQSILEILRETKSDLPEYWGKKT